MNDRQILIREKFNEQYTLQIEMETLMVNSFLKSKTEARYDFSILNIENNVIECRLIQLDIYLRESNNPLIKEISEFTSVFNRMFNELHLQLDNTGKILKILNADLILSKWQQTKAEMEKVIAGNEEVKKVILLNDHMLNNHEKLKSALQANEFIQVYFGHIFGMDIPTSKNIDAPNFFNTVNLNWLFTKNFLVDVPYNNHSGSVTISCNLYPASALTKDFYKIAYRSFADKINPEDLKTEFKWQELRKVEFKTGRIEEVKINKSEVASKKELYFKLKYDLVSDLIKNKEEEIPKSKGNFSVLLD